MSSTFDCMDNAIFAHNGNNRHLLGLLPFFLSSNEVSPYKPLKKAAESSNVV